MKYIIAIILIIVPISISAQNIQFKTGDIIIYAETVEDTVKQYRVDIENDYWGLVSVNKELKKHGDPYLIAALDWKNDTLYEMFDKPVPVKFRDDHYYIQMLGFERVKEVQIYTRNRVFILLSIHPLKRYL